MQKNAKINVETDPGIVNLVCVNQSQTNQNMTSVKVYRSKTGELVGIYKTSKQQWIAYEKHCERNNEGHVRLCDWISDGIHANMTSQADASVWFEN